MLFGYMADTSFKINDTW